MGKARAVVSLLLIFAALACAGEDAVPKAKLPAAARPTRSFVPQKPVDFSQPAREYIERKAGPWTFHLERELVERRPELSDAVIQRLSLKLEETLGLIPHGAREPLRKLSFFILLGSQATGGGRDNGAEFFRSTDPDFYAYLDRQWRNAIVIYSAANYLQQDEHWAVQMLLHELSHAWHLTRWPERQPDILAAWQHATGAKLYQGVKDINGTVLASAYAAHNQLEYFAELSSAYFWRGEYEPYDRAALERYDPAGFAMIEKMWGVHASPPEVSERAGQVE